MTTNKPLERAKAAVRTLPAVEQRLQDGWHRVPVRLRALNAVVHRIAGTSAPFNVHYASRVVFGDRIALGSHSSHSFAVSHGAYFNARNGIEIGDRFLFAPGVVVVSSNHDLHSRQATDDDGPVRIGDNVWLGAHAVVLPGVTIGDNVTVAAGAVVTKDVLSGCVVAGVPAAVVQSP